MPKKHSDDSGCLPNRRLSKAHGDGGSGVVAVTELEASGFIMHFLTWGLWPYCALFRGTELVLRQAGWLMPVI